MINLIVFAVSALLLALLLVWWQWPAFRIRMEAPKFFMLRQEHRLDEQLMHHRHASINDLPIKETERKFRCGAS